MRLPETHAFLLWPYALPRHEEILADIATRFTILDVWRVRWRDDLFSKNLSRFYSSRLPSGSDKEHHCGRGSFLLVVVRDEAPRYASRRTLKGSRMVDARMFDARADYRRWTGGGHRVHATVTPEETAHDLFLLLGSEADAYGPSTAPWTGEIRDWSRDLLGATGWKDRSELFRALRVTTTCVSLTPLADAGTRVVLLTASLWDALMVANGRSLPDAGRGGFLHEAKIGGPQLTLELVPMYAGYLDPAWEELLAATALESDWGPPVASPEDRFYAALYGQLVRGEAQSDSPSLRARAAEAGTRLPSEGDAERAPRAFLARRGYAKPPWRPPELDTGGDFFVALPMAALPSARGRRLLALLASVQNRLAAISFLSRPGEARMARSWPSSANPITAVTVVVVSHNTREYLEKCLSALAAIDLEALVVDSASSDDTVGSVKARFPEVEIIELAENRGFGAAANEAIARTRAPYVLLLNADAWPRGNPVPRLVAHADKDPKLAVIAPALVNTNDTLQRSVFGYPVRPGSLAIWAAAPRLVGVAFVAWRQLGRLRPDRLTRAPHEGRCELVRGSDFPAGAALFLREEGVRRDRGVRRAVLHVQRGNRPVPTTSRPRLAHRVLPGGGVRSCRGRVDKSAP